MKFTLGEKTVSNEHSALLIAEVGTTCNGSLSAAKKLIEVAKSSGCDAVKFQCVAPAEFMSDHSQTYEYRHRGGKTSTNMFEMLKKLEFSSTEWHEIFSYARSLGIPCFSTVDWLGGVPLMEEVKACAYKISSWDLNYPDLMVRMFRTHKPVMIDLGPVSIEAVFKIKKMAADVGNPNVAFLYDFHTHELEEYNLRAVSYLRKVLKDDVVGFSSPFKEIDLDIMALSLGAKILEKRLTLDDSDSGHHHVYSLNPKELTDWVQTIRKTEIVLGKEDLIPSEADVSDAKKYFRSVTALRDIRKGDLLNPENLGAKRPCKGIDPELLSLIWNKRAGKDIKLNTQITLSDVEF